MNLQTNLVVFYFAQCRCGEPTATLGLGAVHENFRFLSQLEFVRLRLSGTRVELLLYEIACI